MKEITLEQDHKLPFAYYYEKPIPADPVSLKSDREILDELAGTMPLSEIAKIIDKNKEPKISNKTEMKAQISVSWKKNTLIIDLYPSPYGAIKQPQRFTYKKVDVWLDKKLRDRFAREKIKEIIYGRPNLY